MFLFLLRSIDTWSSTHEAIDKVQLVKQMMKVDSNVIKSCRTCPCALHHLFNLFYSIDSLKEVEIIILILTVSHI